VRQKVAVIDTIFPKEIEALFVRVLAWTNPCWQRRLSPPISSSSERLRSIGSMVLKSLPLKYRTPLKRPAGVGVWLFIWWNRPPKRSKGL
jgi:hypothetical protein